MVHISRLRAVNIVSFASFKAKPLTAYTDTPGMLLRLVLLSVDFVVGCSVVLPRDPTGPASNNPVYK